MIATEIGVRVQFKHEQNPGGCLEGFNAVSRCYLVDEAGNDIGVGAAFCVAEDQFNKEIGRRIALTRALSNSKLEKDARRQVWEAYFGR
jgi:hypothetical protein